MGRTRLVITSLAAGLGLVVLGGCYERVVGVKGPGARNVEVYEPNLDEDERIPIVDDAEDALFGPRNKKPRSGRPVPGGA